MPARKEETVRAVEDTAAVSLPIDGAVGLGVDIVEIGAHEEDSGAHPVVRA